MKSRLQYHTRSVLRKFFWLYTRRSIGKNTTAREHLQKQWWVVWLRVCGEHILNMLQWLIDLSRDVIPEYINILEYDDL